MRNETVRGNGFLCRNRLMFRIYSYFNNFFWDFVACPPSSDDKDQKIRRVTTGRLYGPEVVSQGSHTFQSHRFIYFSAINHQKFGKKILMRFYNSYTTNLRKPKFWYMDPVDLVRRVVVTSGLVFAPEAQSAMLLSITLNLGYSMTIGNMRPFYCSSTNTVVSLCNSFVVLSALSLFVMNIRYAVEIPYLDETMSFVLFGINVAAVVFTVGVESADGVKNKAMLTAKVVASAALSTTSSSRSFELPSRKMFSLSESSRSFEIKAGPEATVIPEHADSEEEDDDEEKVTG
mmetsp:Transcript_83895/g.237265  ORF Transcript_83895/g.237265 Transcript_83895/m.237265 type:complete len:289 (-) Transcript_83895:396-1262(-)